MPQPWEAERPLNPRMAPALQIMLEGPLGAAAFNNEFGRPALTGYFRSFEAKEPTGDVLRGYDKPIMLAGGVGAIDPEQLKTATSGDAVVVPGGPAIRLAGGAASRLQWEARRNWILPRCSAEPEMQCRCSHRRLRVPGRHNPIRSAYVGAGGLSNAIRAAARFNVGGRIDLT